MNPLEVVKLVRANPALWLIVRGALNPSQRQLIERMLKQEALKE